MHSAKRISGAIGRLISPPTLKRFPSRLLALAVIPLVLIGAIGIGQIAHASAALSKLTVTVANDGTMPFDSAAGPGADVSGTNGVVRSGDYVFFRLDYEVRVAGDLTFTHTLGANAVWHTDSTSNCVQGAAAIDATGHVLTCTLSGVSAGAGSTTIKARSGSAVNGDLLQSSISSSGLTASSTPISISARQDPTINLSMTKATDAGFGPGPGALSGQTGYRLKNALDLWLPVSITSAAHGNQPIDSPITFSVKPPVEYPTSSMIGCDSTAVKSSQPFASGNKINAVRNGGSITCTQSAPGQPVEITITGSDTSLLSWPTKDRAGNNLDGTRAYVFVGSIDWWLPVAAWPASMVTITSQATGFDPTGASGNSNYGSGYQPGFEVGATCSPSAENCTVRTVDNATPVLQNPSFDSQFRAVLPLYTALPGGTSSRSGDGPFFRGQTGEWVFTDNHRGIEQTGVTLCAKWDPTYHRITDNASAGGNQAALMPTTLEYGAIVYANDTERKNSACGITGDGAIGWFPSIAAAGGASAVTAVRATQTTQIIQGQGLNLVLRTTRTSADLPVGAPIPMFYSFSSDQLGNIASTYNPVGHTGALGQRGRAADVRTSVKLAWSPITTISPGQSRELIATPSITAPYELTPRISENTSVTLTLPTACMKYKPGSASIAPSSITAANYGADGIPCSGDDGVGQTLTWNLGNISISTPSGTGLEATIAAIKLFVDFDYGVPSPAPYTSTSVISATNSIDSAAFRTATTTINTVSLTGFSVNKTADRSSLYPGVPVTYTVDWINPTAAGLGRVSVVDLLPFVGDNRGTTAHGTLSVGAVTVSSFNGYSNDVTIEYTTDSATSVQSALSSNNSGDVGISWSTTKPASGITAIRFVVAELAAQERGSATIQITPSNVVAETVMGNSLWGRAGQASVGVDSQGLTVLGAALSKISGTVYGDSNNSGNYNSGDSVYALKTVTLNGYSFGPNGLNESGFGDDVALSTPLTATTDSSGNYSFQDVLPGSYSVTTELPTGKVLSQSPSSSMLIGPGAHVTGQDIGFQELLAAPIALDDLIYTPINTPVVIPVLANDTIAGGGGVLSAVGLPSSGSVTSASSSVTFTPVSGMTGESTFTYTVKNIQNVTASARVRVIVVATPVARQDAATTQPSVPVEVDALANDTGTQLLLQTVGTSPSGVASIVAGKVKFTPNSNFTGTTRISYTAVDAVGQVVSSFIDITVVLEGIANNDQATTPVNRPISLSVLANDLGLALVVSSISNIQHGTAVRNADNTVTFTPDRDFIGTATFTYEITDATGATKTALATINIVAGVAATDDVGWAAPSATIDIDILKNDSGTALEYVSMTSPAHGTCTFVNGVVRYQADSSFIGEDSFTYTVKDSFGNTATANVTINVLAVPLAIDDVFAASADGTYLTLANDLGVNLRVVSTTQPSEGNVSINQNGRIVFQAPAGFVGASSFDYTIEDAAGQRSTANVTITFAEQPTNPKSRFGAQLAVTGQSESLNLIIFGGIFFLAGLTVLVLRRKKRAHALRRSVERHGE